jgi:hypothetical protein
MATTAADLEPGKSLERAAEVEALAEQLNHAVAELTMSEAWLGMLRVSARFTRTSRPTACCCGCRPSSAGDRG